MNTKTNAQRNRNECSSVRIEYENADTLQHIATHCNTQAVFVLNVRMLLRSLPELKVHFVAACFILLQRFAMCCCLCTQHENAAARSICALQHAATHCNTMQHTATHCNTLQHTAPHCNTMNHTVPLCNTLQHAATLQHSRDNIQRAAA